MAIESKWKKGKKVVTEKRVSATIAKLENPDLSNRDIAKMVWTSKSSASRIIKEELGQVGTFDKSKKLYETNLEIINVAAEKVRRAVSMLNPETIYDAKNLQSIVDVAFKQNQLLSGQATERVEVSDLSEEQKEKIAKRYVK